MLRQRGAESTRAVGPATWSLGLLGLVVALLPLYILAREVAARALGDAARLGAVSLSPRLLGLLGNSLALAIATALLATVLGLSLAIWLHVSGGRVAAILRRTYLVPFFLPSYVLALSWLSVAGRRQLLDSLLALLVGPDRLVVSAYGFVPTVLVLASVLSPVVTLIALGLLRAVDAELVEESLVLAPPWVAVRRVLLPLVAPGVICAGGIAFALAFVDYTVPSALQQNVYAMEIYAQFGQDSDAGRAALLAVPLLLPAALVLVASQGYLHGAPLRGRARPVSNLTTDGWPGWALVLTRVAASASILATFGPIVILASRLGSLEAPLRATLAAGRETYLTVAVALVVASLALLLAVPAARIAVGRDRGFNWAIWALPLALPAPLVGVALASTANAQSLDWARETPVVLVLAHLSRLLPFAVLAAAAQVRRLDETLLDAARLHDVGWWRRTWRVEVPLLVPAIAGAWLVTFVLSLGELGATLLVVPPGQATLPLRVYNLMHYGATDAVASLALVVTATAAGAALLVAGLRRIWWPWTA